MPHKKKRTTSVEVFIHEGQSYTTIHKDDNSAWIIEYDIKKRFASGGVKKVDKSFLLSKKITILASNT
jgi:hypothetical protein